VPDPSDEDADPLTCATCEGTGLLSADGDPFDPDAEEAARYDAAEARYQYMRDEGCW
jgi:hypothetical protein